MPTWSRFIRDFGRSRGARRLGQLHASTGARRSGALLEGFARARQVWRARRLGALDGNYLLGTVMLDLATPPNQPHRAEIIKLMTRVSRRGHGVARGLMLEAERIAIERGRTLLVLDTVVEGGAAGFYGGLGYQRVGIIPGYSLKPHGGLMGTIIYFKPIDPLSDNQFSVTPKDGLSELLVVLNCVLSR